MAFRALVWTFQILFLLLFVFWPGNRAGSEDSEWLQTKMQERLQELIDQRLDDFYHDMLVRESYLTYLLKSINQEIRQRTEEGTRIEPEALDEALGVPVDLIHQYQKELNRVLELYDELDALQKKSGSAANPQMVQQIKGLKARISEILDRGNLATQATYAPQEADRLIKEYSSEISRLVKILQEIQALEAKAAGSPYREEIVSLKRRLSRFLDVRLPEDRSLTDRYIQEAMRVVDVLRQLDALDMRVPAKQLELHLQIRRIKDRLLRAIDRKALLALGYRNIHYYADRKRLEEFFEEWKAEQLLWFRAKVQQAQLLKQRLIEEGTAQQRQRMFRRDVLYAVEQFNRGNFGLAEYLFRSILKLHNPPNRPAFQFYLAESLWMQHRLSEAVELYRKIVGAAPGTNLAGNSLYRLMMQAERSRAYLRFFDYADRILAMPVPGKEREFPDEVAIYAAFIANQLGRLGKSEAYLQRVPKSSPYFAQAQFLHAANLLAKGQRAKAMPVLRELADGKAPAPGAKIPPEIQGEARFKLALIYYDEGDLVEALRLLQEVNPKVPDYDAVLMAKAWTEFRLGDLGRASYDLDVLLWSEFTSNYFYEAMMLSAHCDRLQGRVGSAIRKVRYVENAKRMRKLTEDILAEKNRLRGILADLEKLETEIVAAGDVVAYQQVESLKKDVVLALQALAYRGDPGLRLVQEAQDEEQRLVELINQLQDYERIASTLGDRELTKRIRRVLARLGRQLTEVRKLQNWQRIDVFSDYPLARLETESRAKARRIQAMQREVARERERIARLRAELQVLVQKAKAENNLDALSRLEYRDVSMQDLEKKLEVFAAFLQQSDVKIPDTDFTKWADFSGFGMSDLDFVRMRMIDQTIGQHNDLVSVINEAIQKRQQMLRQKIALLDDRIDELEKEQLRKRIAEEQKRKLDYFENQYFVRKTSELDFGWEQNLPAGQNHTAADSTAGQQPGVRKAEANKEDGAK